ncbi:MAG: hypothetical protein HW416_2852 [Chloroflexi bacterium]|nr:hypothetical protein [Chloroflexota bacterium]
MTLHGRVGRGSTRHHTIATLACLLTLVACAPTPRGAQESAANPVSRTPEAAKTIVLGQLNTTKAYAPWEFGDNSGGGAVLAEVHMASLVSQDARGAREPRLAARVPSFDHGSIVVLPDGRMRTTWTLRSNAVWHDGEPFTADDLVFSLGVLRTPGVSGGGALTTVLSQIHSVEAVDPHTFDVVWKTTFYKALDLGVRDFWPFPRHLLEESSRGDLQAFMALPYFTNEYVHLGPFRLAQFQAGEEQVFQRFDRFFLGLPKVDTIIIKTIRDPNAMFLNLKAGAVDVVGERVLTAELFQQLQADWVQSGEGTVAHRQFNWRYLQVQHGAQWVRPPELAQSIRPIWPRTSGFAADWPRPSIEMLCVNSCTRASRIPVRTPSR